MTSYVENSREYRYTYDKRGNLVLEENCARTTQGNRWITEAIYEHNAANRLDIFNSLIKNIYGPKGRVNVTEVHDYRSRQRRISAREIYSDEEIVDLFKKMEEDDRHTKFIPDDEKYHNFLSWKEKIDSIAQTLKAKVIYSVDDDRTFAEIEMQVSSIYFPAGMIDTSSRDIFCEIMAACDHLSIRAVDGAVEYCFGFDIHKEILTVKALDANEPMV